MKINRETVLMAVIIMVLFGIAAFVIGWAYMAGGVEFAIIGLGCVVAGFFVGRLQK